MFELVIMIPVWRRPEITSIVLEYFHSLAIGGLRNITIEVLALVSPEDPDLELEIIPPGVHVAELPNKPISDKWNKGVEYACKELQFNGLMIMGSDNIVTRGFIEASCTAMAMGANYSSGNGLAIIDVNEKKGFFINVSNLGVGGTFSCGAIDWLERMPFPSGRDQGIDARYKKHLRKRGLGGHADISCAPGDTLIGVLDIKAKNGEGSLNINSYDKMDKSFHGRPYRTEIDDFEIYLRGRYDKRVVDRILAY